MIPTKVLFHLGQIVNVLLFYVLAHWIDSNTHVHPDTNSDKHILFYYILFYFAALKCSFSYNRKNLSWQKYESFIFVCNINTGHINHDNYWAKLTS